MPDAALRDALTPDYRIGCKRILRSNDFYPTLARPNTTLVTDPITRDPPDGIETADGTRHDVDVIVYATGFRSPRAEPHEPGRPRGGVSLLERWQQDGVRTHLGVTMSGMPNAFFSLRPAQHRPGPQLVIVMIEAQIAHALDAMRLAEGAARALSRSAPPPRTRSIRLCGNGSRVACGAPWLRQLVPRRPRVQSRAVAGTAWDYRRHPPSIPRLPAAPCRIGATA